jgi:competence protein ComEC
MSVVGRVALKTKHHSALRIDARRTTAAAVVPRPALRTGAYQPLVIVLGAMCAGIFLDHVAWPVVPQSFGLWLALGVVSLGAWLALWKMRYQRLSMAAVMMSMMAISGAWHHYQWNLFSTDEVGLSATQIGQPICVEATVASEPQEVPAPAFDPMRSLPQESQTRLLVDVVAVRNRAEWQSASGRAQVSVTGALNGVHVGDRLRMFGQIEAPAPAGNPGEFDSAQFDRSKRELSFIRIKQPGCASVVEAGSDWSPARWISKVRAAGARLLQSYLPQARSGMAAAVLLGEREEVDRETNEAFLETGTIHILVIAGLHIGILAWAMFLLFSAGWMPRRAALACVMIVTGFYMLLTSAEPPVVRATLLVWIVCGGMLLGRNRIGLNSLAIAAIVVLVVNPTGLFHTGVQLSFLSVAILVCAGQWLTNLWQRDALARLISTTRPWPQRTARQAGRHVAEVFLAGALLWTAITPLTMARFHLFAPAGMLLNVLLLPILPVVMLSGLGVLLFGEWLTPVATICAWICNLGLYVIDSAVKWFAHLPGGRFWVVGPSEAWLAVFYIGLLFVLLAP